MAQIYSRVNCAKRSIFVIAFALLASIFLTIGVIAPSHPEFVGDEGTTSDGKVSVSIEGIDTIIIVNSGDESSIDAAIAAAISQHIGIPVYYTDHDSVPKELLKEFESGIYKDVKDVVILGGEAVVSDAVEQALETHGAVSGDYEVTRVEGVTGTGTAVEAINYFYGPEMLDEVTLVQYEGDHDQSYNDVLQLSAYMENPIIPIPADADSLPADVVKVLEINGVEQVTIVGEFKEEAEFKSDLQELDVSIEEEISGTPAEIETQLEENIVETAKDGDEIVLVEEGQIPPVIPDTIIQYYKDENNDNIDDDSGAALDSVGLNLHNELEGKGIDIEGIDCIGDHTGALEQFKDGLAEKYPTLDVDIAKYEEGQIDEVMKDYVYEEPEEIAADYEERQEQHKNMYELHKQDFEIHLVDMIEQFKAYYAENKDSLPQEAVKLGAQIIDEANKEDAVAQWKLMNAFAAAEHHEEYGDYLEGCQDAAACRQELIEDEQYDNLDDKLEKIAGTEKAQEVANLEVGEKVGLLGVVEFTPPGQEQKVYEEVQELIAQGAKPEELYAKYLEKSKEDGYAKYGEELKKEYEAAGRDAEAIALTPEQIRAKFDERLSLECEAYLAGVVKYDEYQDPVRRAEAMKYMEEMSKEFETKGIKDDHYLTPDHWKEAYDKYSKEGKFTDDDIKRWEAAEKTYSAWEKDNPGVIYNPTGEYWDERKGQFSFTDEDGKVITAVCQGDTCGYTGPDGNLKIGGHEGPSEHSPSNLPSGWKHDPTCGCYSMGDGPISLPPLEYKQDPNGVPHYVDKEGHQYPTGPQPTTDSGPITSPYPTYSPSYPSTTTTTGGESYSGTTTTAPSSPSAPSGDSGGHDSGGHVSGLIAGGPGDTAYTRGWLYRILSGQ